MLINKIISRFMRSLGRTYRYGAYRQVYNGRPKDKYGNRSILGADEGNRTIAEALSSNTPFLAARLGSVEVSALYNFHLYNGKNVKWDEGVVRNMENNAGFFPATPQHLSRYCEEMFHHIAQVDLMAVWYNEGEEEICLKYAPEANYTELTGVEPYLFTDPWSKHLAGKKVLAIHPFADSIRHQYTNHRNDLFPDGNILPEFELKTIKAVQSIAHTNSSFGTWFDAYKHMCDEIAASEFDIAIIGAGAYGLPLGSFVKQMGKQAIHMGGATQILFGVKGSRWEAIPDISKYFNSHWKRPYPHETPEKANTVENACYW